MHKVSIITPAYNCEKFIKSTIQSVLNQTYQNWEMIIVDDASTDGTYNLALEYAKQDERIKVIKNQENAGIGFTRNVAIENATGRYLAFLDADDLWSKEKLSKQVLFMAKNKYPISYTSYVFINENGDLKKKGYVRADKDMDLHKYMKDTKIGLSTSMIDLQITGRPPIPRERNVREDFETWIGMFNQGHKAYGLDDILALYRVRDNQISGNKAKAAAQQLQRYMKEDSLPVHKRFYYWACYASNATIKRFRSTDSVDNNILKDFNSNKR